MGIQYFHPEMYSRSNEELHYFWNISRQFPEYIMVVGWPMAPAARVHTMIGGLRFRLGLARTA